MSFCGTFTSVAIIDVLQILHLLRLTGKLTVKAGNEVCSIYFRRGLITGANHPSEAISIGKVLIDSGAIDMQTLQTALLEQQTAGCERLPLLATLLIAESITKKDAEKAMVNLVEMAVSDLVEWPGGDFTFDAGEQIKTDGFEHFPEDLFANVNIDAQFILLEALRLQDEQTLTCPPS